MLTYNYLTVPNAVEVFKETQDTEVTHISARSGFHHMNSNIEEKVRV
jgi:hypothetical protein